MSQKNWRRGTTSSKKRRIEEIAYLYFAGWSKEELAIESGYSIRTIQRNIKYIESHKEVFLS